MMDLQKEIRLIGIEIGASQHLYGLRMHFTNNISSPFVRASQTSQQEYVKHVFRDAERVSDVYICQDDKSGNIQGMRLVDESGKFLLDKQWNKVNNYVQANQRWKHFRIPPGH